MKRALIFDMDGVIVDNDEFHILAWAKFAEKYGKQAGREEVKSWFGNTNRMILLGLFHKDLTQEEVHSLSREKEDIYRAMYEETIKPLEGLKDFLQRISTEKYAIAVATSAPAENVEFVLGKTGLKEFFPVITDDTMISHGKPDPEIFLKTAGKLGVAASDCIVFEDSLHGIEAARRAGMKVIALATTHNEDKLKHADLVISDFQGLENKELENLFN